MRDNSYFICPCCGGQVAGGARACPDCGSDDRTGWSDKTYLDGLGLPDMDESEYEELRSKEFSSKKSKSPIKWQTIVGMILLIAMFFIFARAASAQSIIIENPYAGVNGGTGAGAWGQYKAQLHAHSTDSDGDDTRAAMLEDHYAKGFHIVAFTEHDFLSTDWDGPINTRTEYTNEPKVPLTSARRAAMERGDGRGGRPGMINIANTIEHTTFHDEAPFTGAHINTYNADFHNLPLHTRTIEHVIARAQELGGISYINHPGRETDGRNSDSLIGIANSNNPLYIKKYVDLLMAYESCVGMEIMNKFDADSRTDRILWDNILKQTMPAGRNVWGFSTDDAHSTHASGFAYNIMLMPELTQAAALNAMRNGTFYAVSHVDRRERINVVSHWSGRATDAHWLSRTLPGVTNVTVSGATITITGRDFTSVDWIADGVKILSSNVTGTTASINLNNYLSSVNSYVRAQLKSNNGIVYLQPFGVRRISNLSSVTQPAAVTGLNNGTAKTAMALGLPAAAVIRTAAGQNINVPVSWNVAAASYDPLLKIAQTFTVGGTFALPPGVTNSNNIPLSVTISVTVKRETFTVIASEFGDSYYHYGRTNAEFHPEAFNMSALTGWTLSPTAVGYGTAMSSAQLTLATTLADGPGAAQAGTTSARHTWFYFKKAFSLPNDIVVDDVLNAAGSHRIDDALIIYINGIEVYRYNAGGTGGDNIANGASNVVIGAPINWAAYTGYNTNATTRPFNINSDYSNRETGFPNVGSDPAVILLDAASLTNLKSALKPGANVITCLVGQNASASSDIWFDLELSIDAAFVPDQQTAVLSPNRTIPVVDDNTAIAVLSGVSANGLSIGPNPVCRSSGAVNFFVGAPLAGARNPPAIRGTLTIYDASGNVVNKININDDINRSRRDKACLVSTTTGSAEYRRIIGSWDLTDRRGRTVSEGTYLVKGVIIGDGKRERVSLMIGVR
ncbi:MAG: hypothetical protein FWE57_07010 [Chitinispirillia bacterium]|nr:hypothetical protein [Chitinispirillia bacterium]